MINELNRNALERATNLGHKIRWELVGEQVADGYCQQCGLTLIVATLGEGLREAHGSALERSCSGPVRAHFGPRERMSAERDLVK